MDQEQKNRMMNDRIQTKRVRSSISVQRKRRKYSLLKGTAILILSAVIFGGVAYGSFYGMNALFGKENTTEVSQQSYASSISQMSYTSNTNSQSLDVSGVSTQGLPSVVAVTNISVQEVQSFFDQFGRNGHGQTQLQETSSSGSGVIIYSSDSELYMVTNYHVVENATTLSVTFVDDQTYQAEICGYDETMDIALLKVSMSDLSADTLSQISVVSVGDSDELVVGQQVVAIGNALGYGQSVTTGIVSALNRSVSSQTDFATYIQTDAAINPGNSGGALFNMNGELVGINTAKVSSTEVEGMGYAIPIVQVLEQINSMISE